MEQVVVEDVEVIDGSIEKQVVATKVIIVNHFAIFNLV